MSNKKVYTKKEILNKLKQVISEEGLSFLYKAKIVNYYGKIEDGNEYYTEVIAEQILKNGYVVKEENKEWIIKGINKIKRGTNNKSYFTKSHEEKVDEINSNSNREEEIFVKKLNKEKILEKWLKLGRFIDFQIPLKDKTSDRAGKIDLLTYKEDTNELFMIEVKRDCSSETLLRCCLEIQTYYQTIADKVKFFEDFAIKTNNKKPKLKKAILIFHDSQAGIEYEEINSTRRKNLKQLLDKFNIEVFIIKTSYTLADKN